jgi:hypothetical protein
VAVAPTARACRLFKVELQNVADETGLTLQVCHYPPGTSKWNNIEHKLFCHITRPDMTAKTTAQPRDRSGTDRFHLD